MSEEFNVKGYHPPKIVKEGECVNCNLCEMICPDFAIFSLPSDAAGKSSNPKTVTMDNGKEAHLES